MLNYRHLYYFWMVAKEGGFSPPPNGWTWPSRPSAPRCANWSATWGISCSPAGRGVAPTDAGQAAFARAEEIFQIGQGLAQEVRTAATKPVIRLSVACPTAFPSWPRTRCSARCWTRQTCG